MQAWNVILENTRQYFIKGRKWAVLEQMVALARAFSAFMMIHSTENLFSTISLRNSLVQMGQALLLLGFWLLVEQALDGFGQYLLSKVSYRNMGNFMVDFQNKLSRIPLKAFDDPEFLDQIEKAKDCLEYEQLGHFASLCLQLFTYYLVYFIALGSYLYRGSPLLLWLLVFAFLPALFTQALRTKYFTDLEANLAPVRRKKQAYQDCILSPRYFKETRVFGAFPYFYREFKDALSRMVATRWQLEKRMFWVQLGTGLFTFFGLAWGVYLLFLELMVGRIQVAFFATVLVSLTEIFALMEELVASHLASAGEILGRVAGFYHLMAYPEVEGTPPALDFSAGIHLRHVSFRYAKQTTFALEDISLSIAPKETVALVGKNGSGKSTLVKVLLGLYAPQTGQVQIGGQEVKGTALSLTYPGLTGVFQDFQHYQLPLSDNVSISDVEKNMNLKEVRETLTLADFPKSFPLDTRLGGEFGGINLSGGLWQRVAIARALYRSHEIIVLDEPTAAIDPLEEARLYEQFRRMVADKTAIIVTHRLASAQFADRVIVLDQGKIVQSGTHQALLAQEGCYQTMWQAQAKPYQAN